MNKSLHVYGCVQKFAPPTPPPPPPKTFLIGVGKSYLEIYYNIEGCQKLFRVSKQLATVANVKGGDNK